MTKQKTIYFDGGKIVKTRASYKIMLEEENCTIFIPIDEVEELQLICQEDEYLIAALLGCIEYVRKSTITDTIHLKKIQQKRLIESVSTLLTSYHIESLTNLFLELKWHEISKILNSESPLLEINNFV